MAESIQTSDQDPVQRFIEWAKKDIPNDPRLTILTEEKHQPYLKYGGLTLLGLYLVFGYSAQLICNVIVFVYPAYCSIKALELTKKEDVRRWLTYWVVFAFFIVIEFFSDQLLSWIPLYWLAKCVFLVWCFLPLSVNGSDVIYSCVIHPSVLDNQILVYDKTEWKVVDKLTELDDNVTHMKM